jgi:hypothetical protein
MIPTPLNVKPLDDCLKEKRIDVKVLKKTLQKYIDENCPVFKSNTEDFQMYCYREVIDNFIDLIDVSE